MARNLDLATPTVRTRQPRVVATGPSSAVIALAQEAFLANKSANASTKISRDKRKELAKLMTRDNITAFEFTVLNDNGTTSRARAAIEPYPVDVIDVNVLRALVDEATFMRVIQATQGQVKEVCGESVMLKSLVTEDRPAELKIKELKD